MGRDFIVIYYEKTVGRKIEILAIDEYSATSHSHNFLEIAYICSGEAEYGIGENKGLLKSGDYFVIDYNTSHYYNDYRMSRH